MVSRPLIVRYAVRQESGTTVWHPDQFKTILPVAASRRVPAPLGYQMPALEAPRRVLSEYDELFSTREVAVMNTTATMDDLLRRSASGPVGRSIARTDRGRALQKLSYERFLASVLETELRGREERALVRRMRAARLPFEARLGTLIFRSNLPCPNVLSENWPRAPTSTRHTNVVLLGPPGVGKTHLACALAVEAIEAGHTARFTTLRTLIGDLGGLDDVIHGISEPTSSPIS